MKRHRQIQGFTLTEIAIVLAVIGLVVAGIFGAASISRYRTQLGQAADEVGVIVNNMRSLYSGQNASAAPTITFPGASLVQQQVYPVDMLVPTPASGAIPAAGTIANHPWDQTTANGSAQLQVAPGQFTVRFMAVPAEACTDLLVKTSVAPTESGLQQIQVDSIPIGKIDPTTNTYTLPLLPTVAAAACPSGAVHMIDWIYSLGS